MARPARTFVETRDRVLATDETHGGVPIPAGSRVAEVTATNALMYGWPSKDVTVDGITVLAGTQLDPPFDGHLRALWARSGQPLHDLVVEQEGTWVTFDQEGRLETIVFRQPTLVRGLRVQHHVEFHPAPGAPLKSAALIDPAVIDGVAVAPSMVQFDERGRLAGR